jgi:inner membrane protein
LDPLTHLTLGTCTGEIILGRRWGKKAMLFGAFAANIPDLDTVAALFVRGDEALLLHRGITHSFCFAIVAGLVLAFLVNRWHHQISVTSFTLFFITELTLHDLLDTCTGYGTGLLEPFSHQRFSFRLLFVVDPLFTIPLLVAAIILILKRKGLASRPKWAAGGLIVSSLYIGMAIYCKSKLDPGADMTTPAPFTTFLWYDVKKGNDGFYTGYQSVFDLHEMTYEFHLQNRGLLTKPETNLMQFADNYYTISQNGGLTHFNVIRFGQVQGWNTINAPFVLSYPVGAQGNENMVIQKGRLAGWNAHSVMQYLERIMGR